MRAVQALGLLDSHLPNPTPVAYCPYPNLWLQVSQPVVGSIVEGHRLARQG